MRGFLSLVLAGCSVAALAAQQPQPSTRGTLWIRVDQSARLIINRETVGLVDRLRVVSVPLGPHVVRVESFGDIDAALEQTVVVSSDQPVPVTFNLGSRVEQLRQARTLAARASRNERAAASIARFSVKVTDTETGLERAGQDNGSRISWTSAVAFCESLVLGGADDWRLPTVEQLEALLASVASRVMEENWNGEFWYAVPGVRASHTRFWSSSRATTASTFTDPITRREIRRPSTLGAFSVGFGFTEGATRILHSDVETTTGAGSALCVRP